MENFIEDDDGGAKSDAIIAGYDMAKTRRSNWESLWNECYDYALPQRNQFNNFTGMGQQKSDHLYDATAMDAVDQLAASLLGQLTPPWTQWFGLKPGKDVPEEEREKIAKVLESAAKTIQSHFDRSNFAVEMHQCFLDLVVGGTASLLFEEAKPGALSAFKLSSVPLSDVVLEEGDSGVLNVTYRRLSLSPVQLIKRYPFAEISLDNFPKSSEEIVVLESIVPDDTAYHFTAILERDKTMLVDVRLPRSPFINFRWMKSPGEVYGRSPVMKALPDIKTANKVVELILKNASIAISGIWQADDDGVLNPANIELTPGSIIPKAVGSKGLTPLDMPARFDVSQLVLDDLRARIRHAMLIDRLPQLGGKSVTATEIIERSAEMSLIMGATYGRLQSELLTPLIQRAFEILRRRGEVPDVSIDGRHVEIDYRSPLARSQSQRSVQNTISWMTTVQAMGAQAMGTVNSVEASKYIGEALGVPSDLIQTPQEIDLEALAGNLVAQQSPTTQGGQDVLNS